MRLPMRCYVAVIDKVCGAPVINARSHSFRLVQLVSREVVMSSGVSRRSVVQGGLAAGIGTGNERRRCRGGRELRGQAGCQQLAAICPSITKPIPSTGELLPVVGLGTNQYSVTAPEEIAARREVLKHFPELGAKVIDTARGYGESEVVIGNLLKELGNRDQIFLATKTPIRGDIAPGDQELELAFAAAADRSHRSAPDP